MKKTFTLLLIFLSVLTYAQTKKVYTGNLHRATGIALIANGGISIVGGVSLLTDKDFNWGVSPYFLLLGGATCITGGILLIRKGEKWKELSLTLNSSSVSLSYRF